MGPLSNAAASSLDLLTENPSDEATRGGSAGSARRVPPSSSRSRSHSRLGSISLAQAQFLSTKKKTLESEWVENDTSKIYHDNISIFVIFYDLRHVFTSKNAYFRCPSSSWPSPQSPKILHVSRPRNTVKHSAKTTSGPGVHRRSQNHRGRPWAARWAPGGAGGAGHSGHGGAMCCLSQASRFFDGFCVPKLSHWKWPYPEYLAD